MIDLHLLIPALLFVIPACCIAYGQAQAATAASEAIETQPHAAGAIRKNFILGLALSETAAILTGVVVIFLITSNTVASTTTMIGSFGILAALGIPSVCIGILSSYAQREALFATARQPFFANEILRLMLITLALMQTSVILGFILAFLINNQASAAQTVAESVIVLASGIAFGLGSVGPLIGLGTYASAACKTVGMNRTVYPQIMSFTFVCQGLIEAPILFSLVIALLIVQGTQADAGACIAAALAMALSTLGPGMASGATARAACQAIGEQPAMYRVLSGTSLLAQTIIDAAPIYGMIIALLLLFF